MNSQRVSILVAVRGSPRATARCLDSLQRQSRAELAERIVLDCSTDGTERLITERYPSVRLLHFDRPMELPELIREGLRHARGEVVALTDSRCAFPPEWLERLLQAHEADYEVIGGAVENEGAGGVVNWACYFSDYAPFMAQTRRRSTQHLAGNHVSYKRRVLEGALDSTGQGFWKVFLHQDLSRQGVRFLFDPGLVAYYSCPDTLGSFLRRYYRDADLFARARCRRMPLVGRCLRLLGAPALPGLLFFQRLRAGLRNKRHRAEFYQALPLIALYATAWAAGEFTGYLRGVRHPGDKVA